MEINKQKLNKAEEYVELSQEIGTNQNEISFEGFKLLFKEEKRDTVTEELYVDIKRLAITFNMNIKELIKTIKSK